jgi:tripartite-type tricarboxylate transporter receptor subunit TctC
MRLIDRRTMSLFSLSAGLSPAAAFAAAGYPARPIHLIVGFTAGASSDVVARVFAQGAGPLLGQQVVVENKPGASSNIGAQYVAQSASDGYTLFVSSLSMLTDEIVNPDRSIRLSRDFSQIALFGYIDIVLVVDPKANVHSVAQLIALATSKPGSVSFASVGAGTLPHLAGVFFEQRAGVQLLHVPYPGSPQAVADVMAGRVTMFFSPASSIIGDVTTSKLLALATAATKRCSALPAVPTMAEAGMPNFDTSLWFGLSGPAGLPHTVIDRLAKVVKEAMDAPQAKALVKVGYESRYLGPDQFAGFVNSEIARWSPVVKAAGMKS